MPAHQISALRDLSLPQVALKLGVPWWKMPYLLFRGKRLFASRLKEVSPVPGMPEVIRELAKEYDLYVVSLNSTRNVDRFLVAHGLRDEFKLLYGNARFHGKERVLRRLAKRGHYDKAVSCYIGDETRDIESAHSAGMKAIAVAWGYNNIRALNRHHPDKIVFDANEIPDYLKKLK
jgi:phosphoglycolate phosphatase